MNLPPSAAERAALRQPRLPELRVQQQNRVVASTNRAQFVAENRGRPQTVVMTKPLPVERRQPVPLGLYSSARCLGGSTNPELHPRQGMRPQPPARVASKSATAARPSRPRPKPMRQPSLNGQSPSKCAPRLRKSGQPRRYTRNLNQGTRRRRAGTTDTATTAASNQAGPAEQRPAPQARAPEPPRPQEPRQEAPHPEQHPEQLRQHRIATNRFQSVRPEAPERDQTGAPRSPQRTPDFLSSLLALANFMRLSLMKAAHAGVGGAPCRKFGYVGRKRWAKPQQSLLYPVKLKISSINIEHVVIVIHNREDSPLIESSTRM